MYNWHFSEILAISTDVSPTRSQQELQLTSPSITTQTFPPQQLYLQDRHKILATSTKFLIEDLKAIKPLNNQEEIVS